MSQPLTVQVSSFSFCWFLRCWWFLDLFCLSRFSCVWSFGLAFPTVFLTIIWLWFVALDVFFIPFLWGSSLTFLHHFPLVSVVVDFVPSFSSFEVIFPSIFLLWGVYGENYAFFFGRVYICHLQPLHRTRQLS